MSTKHLYHDSLYQFDQAQPSFWEATAGAKLPSWPALSGDHHCEVAVIGGGFTGMSTALHLARDHGRDVRVLEAGHIGWGASGRNGGFCSVASAKMSFKRQLRNYGAEQTYRYLIGLLLRNHLIQTLCLRYTGVGRRAFLYPICVRCMEQLA
jgi:glycine/D-amino acid oxidase-like deaminating enzyme